VRAAQTGRLLAALLLAAAAGGCATDPLSQPQASLDNIQTIRAGGLPAMNVGVFTAGPGAPTDMDRSILIRGGSDSAPEGSFARYLADTFAAELKGAGRFDAGAPLTITGVITDTHLTSEGSAPDARLAARITVSRGGRPIFSKEYTVADRWDFVFVGAVAIPDAFNHYAGLFPKLVGALFADPDFAAAVKRGLATSAR
jgi:hypothetical protein